MNNTLHGKDKINIHGILNDFTNALSQQLYYWGCDVVHPDGNLLLKYGMEKKESNGKGSKSLYRMEFEDDIIELHQLCVGRYSKTNPSFLFTRQYRRSWAFNDHTPPEPGFYNKELINLSTTDELEKASRNFCRWLVHYENWVLKNTPNSYRQHCFKSYKKIPKAKSWLQPELAIKWLTEFGNESKYIIRSKQMKINNSNSYSI